MEMVATNALGLTPELAQGMSLGLFILAALMFMLVIYAGMKRAARGQKSLPGAGVVLLVIGVASFVGGLVLKLT